MKKAVLYSSIVSMIATSLASKKGTGLSVLLDEPVLQQSYYPRNIIDQEKYEESKPPYKLIDDPFKRPHLNKGYNNFPGHSQRYGGNNKGNTKLSNNKPQKSRGATKPIRNLEKWAQNQQKHPSLFE